MMTPSLFAEIEGCVPPRLLAVVEQIFANNAAASHRRDEFCLTEAFACGEALIAKALQGREAIGSLINDNPPERAAYLWDFAVKTLSGIYYAAGACRNQSEREFKKRVGAMVVELTEFGGRYLNDTFNPANPTSEPSLFD